MMNNNFNNGATNNNNNSNNGGKFIMTNGTIRTMEAFAGTVKTAMEAYYGDEYKVQVNTVVKNNDLHLTGLTILSKGSNIAPTIYLENYYQMYKEGETMADVCQLIIRVYEEHKMNVDFDVASITDLGKVRDRICYKLINAEHNQELLEDTPYVRFHDLALIFYIVVSREEEEFGTVTVKNNLMQMWNVSVEKLLRMAIVNTQRMFRGKVESMFNVMTELLVDKLDEECANEFFDIIADAEDEVPMYVCSNTSKINGAGVILYDGLLKEFADRVDNNFYILPSSIHETLFIPDTGDMDVNYLKQMVRDVNTTQVAPDEILSDNVYYYDRLTDRVEMA